MEAERTSLQFDGFFRDEHVKLVALGIALTGSREAAADIAQEALLRAYRAWPRVSQLERPGAWTRRVAINLATDAQRRVARERSGARAMRPDVVAAPEPPHEQFWNAVRALPERQRAAVALHYLEDLAVSDVAEILEVAEGTVKASLHAARATLARALGVEQEEEDR